MEAARLAGVSQITIRVAAAQKRLPFYLVGKVGMAFMRRDVEAFTKTYCKRQPRSKLLDV
jgi:hypothetical protein